MVKKARLKPRLIDGETYCVKCDRRNHPDHPLSPYCVDHYARARADAVRKSRENARAYDELSETLLNGDQHTYRDGVHTSRRGTILTPSALSDLRAARGDLLAAYAEARSLTNDFSPGNTADFYLDRLLALKQAIENFNEILGPVLRKPD